MKSYKAYGVEYWVECIGRNVTYTNLTDGNDNVDNVSVSTIKKA